MTLERQFFDSLKMKIGVRGVAIAIYRICISREIVFIVEEETIQKKLENFLYSVIEDFSPEASHKKKNEVRFQIYTKREYNGKWKNLGKTDVCFLRSEKTVKNPTVDLMMQILQTAKKYSEDFTKTIKIVISNVIRLVHKYKEYLNNVEYENSSIPKEKLQAIWSTANSINTELSHLNDKKAIDLITSSLRKMVTEIVRVDVL